MDIFTALHTRRSIRAYTEEPDSDAEESDDRAPGAFDVALPLGEDDAGTDTEHDPAAEADERQGAES